MISRINNFFDHLEDRIRAKLSHYPIFYAFVGGIGIVLFWKGVWETAELFPVLFGPVSVVIGVAIMLSTGLLVSFFIGDRIILSGLTHEKKLAEKTETEVRAEKHSIQDIVTALEKMEINIKKMKEAVCAPDYGKESA